MWLPTEIHHNGMQSQILTNGSIITQSQWRSIQAKLHHPHNTFSLIFHHNPQSASAAIDFEVKCVWKSWPFVYRTVAILPFCLLWSCELQQSLEDRGQISPVCSLHNLPKHLNDKQTKSTAPSFQSRSSIPSNHEIIRWTGEKLQGCSQCLFFKLCIRWIWFSKAEQAFSCPSLYSRILIL